MSLASKSITSDRTIFSDKTSTESSHIYRNISFFKKLFKRNTLKGITMILVKLYFFLILLFTMHNCNAFLMINQNFIVSRSVKRKIDNSQFFVTY